MKSKIWKNIHQHLKSYKKKEEKANLSIAEIFVSKFKDENQTYDIDF